MKNKDREKENKQREVSMCGGFCVCKKERPCIPVCYQVSVCVVFLAPTYQSGPAGRLQSSVGRGGVS